MKIKHVKTYETQVQQRSERYDYREHLGKKRRKKKSSNKINKALI